MDRTRALRIRRNLPALRRLPAVPRARIHPELPGLRRAAGNPVRPGTADRRAAGPAAANRRLALRRLDARARRRQLRNPGRAAVAAVPDPAPRRGTRPSPPLDQVRRLQSHGNRQGPLQPDGRVVRPPVRLRRHRRRLHRQRRLLNRHLRRPRRPARPGLLLHPEHGRQDGPHCRRRQRRHLVRRRLRRHDPALRRRR